MSRLDGETKRKLREMNAAELLEAMDTQDETLSISLSFEERVRLVVDDAYSTFTHSKVAAGSNQDAINNEWPMLPITERDYMGHYFAHRLFTENDATNRVAAATDLKLLRPEPPYFS